VIAVGDVHAMAVGRQRRIDRAVARGHDLGLTPAPGRGRR
jgi:hypothetical protein